MRSLRILVHPAGLVALAIVTGIALHRLTAPDGGRGGDRPPGAPAGGELVTRSLPAAGRGAEAAGTPPGDGASGSAAAGEEATSEKKAAAVPASPEPPSTDGLEPVRFREVWAYLMHGESSLWDARAPLTDVCLFNYGLKADGHLKGTLKRETVGLVRRRGARAHVVIASAGQASLLHFLLNPNYRAQNTLVGEILSMVRRHDIDGLQLDLESLLPQDRFHFIAFVRRLRAELPPGLIFSLALPAQHEVKAKHPLRYRGLEDLADRYIIMVYDEHWRTSGPGSISSRGWHDRVVAHALRELPREKVVIGLPLYGRIWQVDSFARATAHRDLAELIARYGATVEYDADRSHRFTFETVVRGEGWFEDAVSLHAKMASARQLGAAAVGFWRLGKEDPRVWSLVAVER